jgi:DNA primase
MGKIAPISSKYIIHATINIDGVVDRPDVIGAIFGQTEGLLGSDLELRELQRSGRIGRIEVNIETKGGKSSGTIIIPSSLDKAETSIIAAALEIIQRIGPCNAKIEVQNIEDVRISKRNYVVERAKSLLKSMMEQVLPDSQELADEVAYSVRVMEIQEYGRERLPAGPAVDESEEVIVVEGRADVLNLLKHGIKNAIAINGTSVPKEIVELSKKKVLTALVDGDRGGRLIVRELMSIADIDFVCFAPDGKEIEELTKKEIHKTIRSKIAAEQVKMELEKEADLKNSNQRPQQRYKDNYKRQQNNNQGQKLSDDKRKTFKDMLTELVGTRGAYILDEKLSVLGKVPVSELNTTVRSLGSGIYAIIFDGIINRDLLNTAEKSKVRYLIGMDSKVRSNSVEIYTVKTL